MVKAKAEAEKSAGNISSGPGETQGVSMGWMGEAEGLRSNQI